MAVGLPAGRLVAGWLGAGGGVALPVQPAVLRDTAAAARTARSSDGRGTGYDRERRGGRKPAASAWAADWNQTSARVSS